VTLQKNEEKSEDACLTQQNAFGPTFLHSLLRLGRNAFGPTFLHSLLRLGRRHSEA
jgi:hypothetical protein